MYKSLADIKPGNGAAVIRLEGGGALKRRIMDMGITKGAILYVRRTAPLGDPIEITVRGYRLSLRKKDAKNIKVIEI